MQVIEHQKIRISKKTNVEKLEISDKNAEFLKKLEIVQGKQIFKWGANYVTPQQWVGVISTPEVTIEILPKITEELNKDIIRNTFVNMLKIANDIPVRSNINANISYGNQGFIDVLAAIFLRELEKQINKGINRTYIKKGKNLNAVKGKINFNKQISKNSILKNKFFCDYSVLDTNNYLNQVIKYTLTILKSLVRVQSNHNQINKLYQHYDNVSLINLSTIDFNRLTLNRLTIEYRDVLNYCELFVTGKSLDISAENVNVNFLLFDMNKLFEMFIYKSYQKLFKDVRYQVNNQHLIENVEGVRKKKIVLKPDIILNVNSECIIIDTKWKLTKGFANELDIYQMSAYLNGFSRISKAILLYPKTIYNDKMVGEYQFINQDTTRRLKIATVDVTKLEDKQAFFHYLKEIIQFNETRSR